MYSYRQDKQHEPARLSVSRTLPNARAYWEELDWSGRAMARSGLRMMPTFPLPSLKLPGRAMARTRLRMMLTFPSLPLKFRKAGFTRYGFKAGRSGRAFPTTRKLPVDRFASALRAPRFRVSAPLCVGGRNALKHLRASGYLPLYPRGPRSGPGYVVPVHHHLIGPMRPACRHISTSPQCGLYEMPSLCVLRRLGDPQVVPCFRWLSSIDMSPSETPGSSSAACTQFLRR